MKLTPDDPDVLLLAAECYMGKRNFDNARNCLTHGIKLQPPAWPCTAICSSLSNVAGKPEKAAGGIAGRHQGHRSRSRILLWLMADALVDSNKLDESRKLLDELGTKSFPKRADRVRRMPGSSSSKSTGKPRWSVSMTCAVR